MSENRRATSWAPRLIWIVLALALILRLAYLLEYYQSPYWEQLTVDNWYHHHWAESLAGGNVLGDTTYFRAPLYVYCLGALYAVFGSSLWVGRLFGLFIGLGTIAMTYVVARRFLGYAQPGGPLGSDPRGRV